MLIVDKRHVRISQLGDRIQVDETKVDRKGNGGRLVIFILGNGDESQTGMFVPPILKLNLEVGLDHHLYDIHSFRRGRAQYFDGSGKFQRFVTEDQH